MGNMRRQSQATGDQGGTIRHSMGDGAMFERTTLAALAAVLCLGNFSAGAAAGAGAGMDVTYDLPEGGRVSMVIFDAEGNVVRELLHAAPREMGRNTERWDGLDEKGKPVGAGAYRWKLLLTQGLVAEYLLTLGTNPTPRWDTWPGNHGGAYSVDVNAGGMYVAGGCGEGTIAALKQTLDGKRIWNVPHWLDPWQGASSLASSGGRVYMLQANQKIQVLDDATGKRVATWDAMWDPADRKKTKKKKGAGELDMDAGDGQIVVSYPDQNAIRWLDPKTGKTIAEKKIPEPLGVAVDPSGRVLVISKDTVLAVTRDAEATKTIVTGLESPFRLDVEEKTGAILLVERGKSLQIKRFSKAGKFEKAYGLRGGRRRHGKYNPAGFAELRDIASDQRGGFIVIDPSAPRRTTHIDKAGRLVRDWYGGQKYSNLIAVDPDDPRTTWLSSQWGEMFRAQVDYENKTWRVETIYGGKPGDARRHAGRTYLCTSGQAAAGKPKVFRLDDETGRQELVADLSAYGFGKNCSLGQGFTYLGFKRDKVYRVPVTGWSEDGKPTYGKAVVVGEVPAMEKGLGSREAGPVTEDAQGNVYFVGNRGDKPFGLGWWGSTTGSNRVLKWDKAGKFQWAVGRHAAGVEARGGEGKYLWGPIAAVKGCLLVRDVEAPVHVWDADGLWVGGLFDQPDTKAAPQAVYKACGESFYGCVVEVPPGAKIPGLRAGDVLFFAGGQNNNPVFRIRGWDKFKRQGGSLAISAERAAKIAESRRAELARTLRIPHIGLGYMNRTKVDGKLGAREWKKAKRVQIKDGDKVVADVYLAWQNLRGGMNTAHGLTVAFDVHTAAPWKSASMQGLAFRGGAAVEIRLGPPGDDRKTAGVGDLWIVAAPIGAGGKTVAVEFIPPRRRGRRNSAATYSSKTGKVTYDRVSPLNGSYAAATVKPDGGGYVVEMQFRLRRPLYVRPGLKFRLDAAVMLANPDGTAVAKRLPWHSKAPAARIVNDPHVEATLRPNTWAEAMLE